MSDQSPVPSAPIQVPSLAKVVCPNCGSSTFTPLGKKGARGTAAAVGGMFGAVGALVANAANKDDLSLTPTNYKCDQCHKKFETMPLLAQPDEMLSAPCKVVFTRKGSFVGMAVSETVWLNGVKIGPVGNGKSLEFPTYIQNNLIFVTDQYGVAFKGCYRFAAQPGGVVQVDFNRKFQ